MSRRRTESPDDSPLRAVWRIHNFRMLWLGQSASYLGSQVTLVALPLTAVLVLDAGALQTGVLAALNRVPYLLLGLPVGVWVDQLPKRHSLMAINALLAGTLLVVPVTAATGQLSIEILYGVAFVAGALTVFFDIAYLAFVPTVVSRRMLTDAQSMIEVTQSTGQLAGPAIAGALIQLVTAPFAILIDSITYLVGAVSVWWVRGAPEPKRGHRSGMVSEMKSGTRAVYSQPILRSVTLTTASYIFWFSGYSSMLVLYLVNRLSLSPIVVGTVLAAGAAGGLCGAVAAAPLGRRFGNGSMMVAALVLSGLGAALGPLAHVPSPLFGFALIIASQMITWFGQQAFNVYQVPVRYALNTEDLYGRVNATVRTTVWGSAPGGALLAGVVAESIGLPATLLLMATGAGASALIVALGPARDHRSIEDLNPTAAEVASADG